MENPRTLSQQEPTTEKMQQKDANTRIPGRRNHQKHQKHRRVTQEKTAKGPRKLAKERRAKLDNTQSKPNEN